MRNYEKQGLDALETGEKSTKENNPTYREQFRRKSLALTENLIILGSHCHTVLAYRGPWVARPQPCLEHVLANPGAAVAVLA